MTDDSISAQPPQTAAPAPERPRERPAPPAPTGWLVRVPAVFEPMAADVFRGLGTKPTKRLGTDFHLVKATKPPDIAGTDAGLFVRWLLPVHHSWPCHPSEVDGFIEKAAQALAAKFAPLRPQGVFVGQLATGSPGGYYKGLASNLRGRLLQVFPKLPVAAPEDQRPGRASLFCLVGREGLFAGMASPLEANGFYPGGTKYMAVGEAVSRAGAKVAEALHHLTLHQPPPRPASQWLELGASPGGMTAELLARKWSVTAIDRAPLDARLVRERGVDFHLLDVKEYRPAPAERFDGILCDMNGPALEAMQQVVRLSRHLNKNSVVIFTLKTAGAATYGAQVTLARKAVALAAEAGLKLLAKTHLTYNRQEFTLLFTRRLVRRAA